MNSLQAALADLELELERLGVSWALVGGLAISARATPRTTRDIDVCLAVGGDREAEHLVRELVVARGYRYFEQQSVLEHDSTGRMATVRLRPRGSAGLEGVIVDLMFGSSGIEPEIAGSAELAEVFPGVQLPVAQVGHLIALKLLAGRAQDLADLESLRGVAGPRDVEMARVAVDLISRRGADRDKDLLALLRQWERGA